MWPPSPWASMRGRNVWIAVDDAAEEDPEPPVPVVVPGGRDRPEKAHAGVVAEHVDVAEDALCLVGRARQGFAVGDVELDRVDALLQSTFAEALQGGRDVVGPEVGDHDVHARVHERLGHAEADTARAPGDERGPSRDLLHASYLSTGQEASAAAFPARRPSSTVSRSGGTGSSGNAARVSSKISRSSSRWSGCVKT